jgi:hypothetical protein
MSVLVCDARDTSEHPLSNPAHAIAAITAPIRDLIADLPRV